jgi:hypothetical protein
MSNSNQPPENINWKNLVQAVRDNECILVLGPHIATVENEGETMPLTQLLASHLAEELKKLNPGAQLINPKELAYVAKQLEDTFILHNPLERDYARQRLCEIVQVFYEKYDHTKFPVYQMLARLPFRFVINTSPDHFLSEAYDYENKFGAGSEYFHFRNPEHNSRVNILEENIRPETPLVYNLFGSVSDPESLVITEADQLAFLDNILQREQTATIPKSVAIQFTSQKDYNFPKTFLFLGFDFNQWHLRLLMHLISRFKKQKATYALQNPRSLTDLTAFFYQRNFEVQFVDVPPQDFAINFENQLRQQESGKETAPDLKVFLMFDENDAEAKEKLDSHLSVLKRSDLIDTWDEEHLLAGTERQAEIDRQLSEADLIILLVTPNFFASDEIYEKQLKKALERDERREAVVIPILMESCLWQSSVLGKLPTVQPRNRRPLDVQENEEAALAGVVEQIEKICQKFYKRKTKTAAPHP